jgi:hypothetical protein
MIDPTKITKFNRTKNELEEFILFAILVAFRDANVIAKTLDRMLNEINCRGSPFHKFKWYDDNFNLKDLLVRHGTGLFAMKSRAVSEVVHSGLDLKTCTLNDLLGVYGIGRKTATFFLLHTRENARLACLDTHILACMRDLGYANVPRQTPSPRKYLFLEGEYLSLVDKSGYSASELDLIIWNTYSGKSPDIKKEQLIKFLKCVKAKES